MTPRSQRLLAEAELIRKVWDDDSLESELLRNPTAVYREQPEFADLDPGVEVRVVAESEKKISLVLPDSLEGVTAPERLSTNSSRAEFEAALIFRALSDPEYRRRLIASPFEVYREHLQAIDPSLVLPDSIEISTLEETPTTRYLRLPPKPTSFRELTSEEIAAISGGAAEQRQGGPVSEVAAVGVVVASVVVGGAAIVAVAA